MELFIFARFHALEGREAAVAAAIRDVAGPTRRSARAICGCSHVICDSSAGSNRAMLAVALPTCMYEMHMEVQCAIVSIPRRTRQTC